MQVHHFSLLALAAAVACAPAAESPAAARPAPSPGPMVQTTNPMNVQPEGAKPAWAPTIDPQMHAVVEQFMAFEQPPLPEMTAFQARNAKSAAAAVMMLLHKTGIPPMPAAVDMAHRVLPVGSPEGTLVRTYTPRHASVSAHRLLSRRRLGDRGSAPSGARV